jgi:hypothetical protein
MTITADQVSLPLNMPGIDKRPGSSDVAWAERAYHHEPREGSNERRSVPRAGRRRLRTLVVALAVLFLTAGLVVVMRYQGSAPAPVSHRPASSQTVTAPRSPFTLTPTFLNPFPSPYPTINTLKR